MAQLLARFVHNSKDRVIADAHLMTEYRPARKTSTLFADTLLTSLHNAPGKGSHNSLFARGSAVHYLGPGLTGLLWREKLH